MTTACHFSRLVCNLTDSARFSFPVDFFWSRNSHAPCSDIRLQSYPRMMCNTTSDSREHRPYRPSYTIHVMANFSRRLHMGKRKL